MKLLANAHISRMMIEFLQREGHDCVHAELIAPGMPDAELLDLAVAQHRVILTADKDFGEIVFRRNVPAIGVVLLRIRAATESERFDVFRRHWPTVAKCIEGHFVVVTNRRVRRTPIPPRGD